MDKYVKSQHYLHELFGEIAVKELSTATRVTARWKSYDLLAITVPKRLKMSEFLSILEKMTPRLLVKRPEKQFFTVGWKYETPEMDFEVVLGNKENVLEGHVDRVNQKITLFYPPDLDSAGNPDFNDWVNKTLDKYARTHAAKFLLPEAHDVASKLNIKPKSFDISHGQKVLGRCNSRGEILLSRNLIYYPIELRRFVIAHELAHLTHMNHSKNFYELLNTYVDGKQVQLDMRLKHHKLPFLK